MTIRQEERPAQRGWRLALALALLVGLLGGWLPWVGAALAAEAVVATIPVGLGPSGVAVR